MLICVLCNLDADFCGHYLKLKSSVPKKYFKQLKSMQSFSNNEDIYYIYFNCFNPVHCIKEIEFVFGSGGRCYHLDLRENADNARTSNMLNLIAHKCGGRLEIENGVYLGTFEIENDVDMQKTQFSFQMRTTAGENFIDMVKTFSADNVEKLQEVAFSKLIGDGLQL